MCDYAWRERERYREHTVEEEKARTRVTERTSGTTCNPIAASRSRKNVLAYTPGQRVSFRRSSVYTIYAIRNFLIVWFLLSERTRGTRCARIATAFCTYTPFYWRKGWRKKQREKQITERETKTRDFNSSLHTSSKDGELIFKKKRKEEIYRRTISPIARENNTTTLPFYSRDIF